MYIKMTRGLINPDIKILYEWTKVFTGHNQYLIKPFIWMDLQRYLRNVVVATGKESSQVKVFAKNCVEQDLGFSGHVIAIKTTITSSYQHERSKTFIKIITL